jgi:hypothetical protein
MTAAAIRRREKLRPLPLRAAALALRIRQGADLITVHHHLDAISKLLELRPIDGDRLFAKAEEAPDLNLNRLNFAVRSFLDMHDLSEIFAIGAESWQASQPPQALVSLGLSSLLGSTLLLRLSRLALPWHSCRERLPSLLHNGDNGLA